MADHDCLPARRAASQPQEATTNSTAADTLSLPVQTHSLLPIPSPPLAAPSPLLQYEKPRLPRIDASATNRSGFYGGELTPVSSQGSIVASPISSSSGGRSPFMRPQLRKGSMPTSRRPPSPELLSQDCAFPPFPTSAKPKRAGDNARRDNSRGRTQDGNFSASQSVRSSQRSISMGPPRQKRTGTMTSSRSSTAMHSRRPSVNGTDTSRKSSQTESRKASVHEIPPLPPLVPTLSNGDATPDQSAVVTPLTPTWPFANSEKGSPNSTASKQDVHKQVESTIIEETEFRSSSPTSIYDFPVPEDTVVENPTTSLPDQPQDTAKESGYKSKRPPPLLSSLVSNKLDHIASGPKTSDSTIGSTSTSGSFARTLTGFFSRRRAQSISSKKSQTKSPVDSLRSRALSPDADESIPPKHEEPVSSIQGVISPLPTVVKTILLDISGENDIQENHASLENEPEREFVSPEETALPERKESITDDYDEVVKDLESALNSVLSTPLLKDDFVESDDARRASIDSASSYGSIGFSHSSSSSRSTNPTEMLRKDIANTTSPPTTENIKIEIPPPLAIRSILATPESPTDPLYQNGLLSPTFQPRTSVRSENIESVIERPTSSTSPEKVDTYDFKLAADVETHPVVTVANKGHCKGCTKLILITEKSVSSKDGRLSGRYHKSCFVCRTCQSPFATADFYVHDDHPYCAHDYHILNDTICTGCNKGIEGQYIETSNLSGQGSKKFHSHCLRCSTCKVQLDDDYFELNGRIYCEKDAFRIANGPRNPYDTAPSRPSPLVREYISSVDPGLKGRFPERRITRMMMTPLPI